MIFYLRDIFEGYRNRLRQWLSTLFLIALVTASCTPGRRATVANRPTPTSSPTLVAATPSPASTADPQTIESSPSTSVGNLAPLFGPAWGDRNVYRRGLVVEEQRVLDEFRGASEYRIDLDLGEGFTSVRGRQQVHYTNREEISLNEIFVRLFPNALGGEMTVSDVTVDGVNVSSSYEFERTALRVPLPQPLVPGQDVILSMNFQITVPETLDQGYGLLSHTQGILALDTPYAAIPVYDDEGWNVETPPPNADTSFNDASFYLVRVTAPSEFKLVTTGVEVEQEIEDGTQMVTFSQGPARDFFISGSTEYVTVTEQLGETQISSYALADQEKAAKIALDAAVNALRVFSRRFGPYPYTEFDVAATPMLALGIEYLGTVGITERLYDPNGQTQAQIIEGTVAHEVAHQWFYNLVGSDQIDEPWLDEAFAQYITWLFYVDQYGAQAAEGWRASWESRWDRIGRRTKPVGLPAGEYGRDEYSPIVYGRGPLFLSALAERMGQQVFDQFLSDYAMRFRWGITTTGDFKSLAEDACKCELDDLYVEWLDPVEPAK